MPRFCLLPLLLLCAVVRVFSQNDTSLLLTPERLTESDVLALERSESLIQVFSANRTLEDASDLPYMVWVATAEDILRNGFVTLGDVLRAAPGIRVSQPGNAAEGETFLMRGLRGNQYVKVLINDVPVKPFAALGMPIGSQLPIRQAERIEVVYGPSGVLYGNEACAGVINIILKESERPVYTQADLSFGRFGYNNIDVTMGGKLGRDNRIFRFSLFGSSTTRAETDVYQRVETPALYNTDQYVPDNLPGNFYQYLANYSPSLAGANNPRLSPIPHDSRLLGLNLRWRGLYFQYYRMSRLDHVGLGLNPLAISHANASTQLSELNEVFALGYQRQRRFWKTHNSMSLIRYRVKDPSTALYAFDQLAQASYQIQVAAQGAYSGIIDSIYNRYNSGERNAFASGLDVRIESRINTKLGRRFTLDVGLLGYLASAYGLFGHHKVPPPPDIFLSQGFFVAEPATLLSANQLDGALSTQLQYRDKRWYVAAGINAYGSFYYSVKVRPMTRFALQYQILKGWTVGGHYSTGLRQMSPYYSSNSFYVNKQNGALLGLNEELDDAATRTEGWEARLRYRIKDDFKFEVAYFGQKAADVVRANTIGSGPSPDGNYTRYGYDVVPGRGLFLWGLQGLLTSQGSSLDLNVGKKTTELRLRAEFFIQYTGGKEWLPNGVVLDEVINQPRWHTQFRTFLYVKKLMVMLASNRQTSTLRSAVTYQEQFGQRLRGTERNAKFRSWDMMARLSLSKQFMVYCQMLNVFNREVSGLDATGTSDDLLFNPQPGRTVRFGVNYNLN